LGFGATDLVASGRWSSWIMRGLTEWDPHPLHVPDTRGGGSEWEWLKEPNDAKANGQTVQRFREPVRWMTNLEDFLPNASSLPT
jgi:hypothetical protein